MFMTRLSRGCSACAGVYALTALTASSVTAQIVTADGFLDPETALVLLDPNSGVPNIFTQNPRYSHAGWARFRLDGERLLDVNATNTTAGIDGFRDAGFVSVDVPPCDSCADTTMFQGFPVGSLARSGMNTGKLTVIYLANSTGLLATDDSLLYVGMDVFNGNGHYVGAFDGLQANRDKRWHRMDWEANPGSIGPCSNGIFDPNHTGVPQMLGVPFDLDADGDPFHLSRWTTRQPQCPNANLDPNSSETDYRKSYQLVLYNCPPTDFADGEDGEDWWNQGPPGHALFAEGTSETDDSRGVLRTVELATHRFNDDPNGYTLVHLEAPGFNVPGVVLETFPQDGMPLVNIGVRDIEFVIRRFDTLLNALCPVSGDSNRDYQINRFRAAQAGLRTISRSDADSTGPDRVSVAWFVPLPSIEVTKAVRRIGTDANAPWFAHINALPRLPGDANDNIEFRITVENTGNVPLYVTLTDVLETFGNAVAVVDPNFFQATIYRPANGAGVPVTLDNANLLGLNPDFFCGCGPLATGFLSTLSLGTPIALGTLQPVQMCAGTPTLGDKLQFVFRIRLTLTGDNGPLRVDARNSILASAADPDHPQVPLVVDGAGLVALDPNHGVDTAREAAQGYDDNVAEVDLVPVGDLNCDGVVGYGDINPLVVALRGRAFYEAAYPGCNWFNADCNGDGLVNYADINPFVALLASRGQ